LGFVVFVFSSKQNWRTHFFESKPGKAISEFYMLFSASHTVESKKHNNPNLLYKKIQTSVFRYKLIYLRIKINEPCYSALLCS